MELANQGQKLERGREEQNKTGKLLPKTKKTEYVEKDIQ
jgi:hypothetical protein